MYKHFFPVCLSFVLKPIRYTVGEKTLGFMGSLLGKWVDNICYWTCGRLCENYHLPPPTFNVEQFCVFKCQFSTRTYASFFTGRGWLFQTTQLCFCWKKGCGKMLGRLKKLLCSTKPLLTQLFSRCISLSGNEITRHGKGLSRRRALASRSHFTNTSAGKW